MQIAPPPHARQDSPVLAQKAQALEAAFLAEMLKHAAPMPEPGAFGGGTGAAQFHSFLREEQAQLMAGAGGLGLAAHLYRALMRETGRDAG